MENRKLCIVNIGAHAYDLIKGAGGTLIKYAKAGHRVVPLVLSDCYNRGELPPSTTRKEAAEIQREEVRQVSKLCGFDQPQFLHYSELDLVNLQNDMVAIKKIADVIRVAKPDIIFTHWPQDQSSGFYNHGNAGLLGTKATKIAAMPDYESEYPLHETKLLVYFLSTDFSRAHLSWGPKIFINIEDEIEMVHQCYQIYRTHTATNDDGTVPTYLREYRLIPKRFWGVISGTLYAEAFALPQFIGAQYAFNWFPEPWISTTGRAILSNVTDKDTGAVAHPRLSIPEDWPDAFPPPRI
jgi:LmbE family N-acetylglucosaminyl deacetylase